MRAHMQVCVPRLQVWLMAAQSTQASPSEPQKDELNPGSQVFLTLKRCPEITWTGCSDWGLLT